MQVWRRDKTSRILQVGRSGLLCARNRPGVECLGGLLENLRLSLFLTVKPVNKELTFDS